ncbi:hypothetical protein V5799_030655 [Amblyomma americanum]|uniref:Uncharacterized protein n=1 Tax=Amblyomma americanum TaxID=6943 RepID=A0AAQ4ENG3_AMBAM
MKAQPFTMCVNCATLYGNAIGIFYQLETNTTDPGTRLCQDQFFSSSKVSIVDKTFKHIHDLWKSASCDGCFQHPVKGNGTHVVRNETIMFNEKLVQMNKCINQSEAKSKNLTDLCIICERPYRDLNTFYNGLVQESKDGNICFDMVDASLKVYSSKHLLQLSFLSLCSKASAEAKISLWFYIAWQLFTEACAAMTNYFCNRPDIC